MASAPGKQGHRSRCTYMMTDHARWRLTSHGFAMLGCSLRAAVHVCIHYIRARRWTGRVCHITSATRCLLHSGLNEFLGSASLAKPHRCTSNCSTPASLWTATFIQLNLHEQSHSLTTLQTCRTNAVAISSHGGHTDPWFRLRCYTEAKV